MLMPTAMDNANHKGQTVSFLCIDVEGAFVNIYRDRLLKTMMEKTYPPHSDGVCAPCSATEQPA